MIGDFGLGEWLALAGIVLTIGFGVWGWSSYKRRLQRQSQTVRGGVAIQAGRDIKLGKGNDDTSEQ